MLGETSRFPMRAWFRPLARTPEEVSKEIVSRIKDRAIEPQVEVALVTQNTSLITVIGEINSSTTASPTGRIPAQPAGERILDVITRAGGLKDQGQDTWVVLERRGRRAAVPFGSLIYEPGNNVWAWPGDTLYLYKEPQTFLAFGASGLQGQFPFSAGAGSSAWRMTLAEGVAAAGGLLDLTADPGSVFLYRREPRELAEKLGVDCSKMDGPTVPVVYSTSFADPAGYFLATRLQMHNKDVIFVANAQSVDITKFANFLNTLISVPTNVVSMGNTFQTNQNPFCYARPRRSRHHDYGGYNTRSRNSLSGLPQLLRPSSTEKRGHSGWSLTGTAAERVRHRSYRGGPWESKPPLVPASVKKPSRDQLMRHERVYTHGWPSNTFSATLL